MHTHLPNAAPGARDIYHAAVFAGSTVRLSRRTGSDSTSATYQQTYAVMVPWNAFVYGTWELLFRAAAGLPDTTRIGQYFFEGWSEGNIGYARVRGVGTDSVAITSTGLSGAGVAHLDETSRLLSYSGGGTTYKQEVRRIPDVPDIDAIAEKWAETERTRGVARSLSARDTARGRVGGAALEIDYSRPLARGRTLVGGLIPYGAVWRTGANAATQLAVSAPVEIGGIPLDSGTYTLWTLPAEDGVQLIVNRQAGQWGTQYGPTHDIARTPMRVDTLVEPVEQFTIRIDTVQAAAPRLAVEWGTFRWSVPVVAETRTSRRP
jgi:hypothetical protein